MRLFVAIRPPQPIRDQLLDVMGGVRHARWQDEDQLHLTLRFVGEVDRHCAEDLAAALGQLHYPAFDLALSGVGCFEQRGRKTLWAGVAPTDVLRALHKKVDGACRRVGLAADRRTYHPHVTLARFGRGAGPFEPFLQRWAGLTSPRFRADSFRLYESRLGAEGADYTAVARYPLGGFS